MLAAAFDHSFNPRPPISQRATSSSRSDTSALQAFQSTPANFTAGDWLCSSVIPSVTEFQSTPANFTAGDAWKWSNTSVKRVFQSTPANFTAGDEYRTCQREEASKFQSTPANFTAGDGQWGTYHQREPLVSIHARQFHSGRPCPFS